MKRILLLVISAIIFFGVCGCMENTTEQLKNIALKHLTENYDDTFKPLSLTHKSWAYDFAEVVFQSEKYKDPVRVRIYEDPDGKKYCVDNYYQLDMMQDAVEYFTQFNSCDVRVSFLNTVWSDKLSGSTTFGDWVEKGNCKSDVYYFSEIPITAEEQERIVQKIIDANIAGTIYFFEVKASVADQTLDEILNNQDEFIKSKSHYFIEAEYKIVN